MNDKKFIIKENITTNTLYCIHCKDKIKAGEQYVEDEYGYAYHWHPCFQLLNAPYELFGG